LVARFLVTTALEDTWPSEDVPILFLGEWCRLYGRKAAWEKLDAVVAPYHWDDRQKLHKDYLYLQALHEELLEELATQLNELHGVNHSVRYWRILVGVWLGYFIQMLFDRWAMLQQVLLDYEISGIRLLRHSDADLVPNDMTEFCALFTRDDWNEMIYGHILSQMGVSVEKIDSPNRKLIKGVSTVSPARRLKRGLALMVNQVSGTLSRNTEHFFISSYLGAKQEMLLQTKLGQLPKLWQKVDVPVSVFDRDARQWPLALTQDDDGFPSLARTLIQSQIPTSYVEGYRELISLTEKLPWPKRPKAIFTSNSYSSDEVFKAWAAKKVESGTPLIIGQHGGNYGVGLWNFTEDHQIAISDHYLTWGWSQPGKNVVTPIGNFKSFGKTIVVDKVGIALLVEMTIPPYSYHMFSMPVAAGQWLVYFEDQCRFVQALPVDLRDQLLVRNSPQDYDFSQKGRWQERFPDIHIDEGKQPMAALLKKTRIFISTYNATTYLESLSLNLPTLIFWNPEHSELRESALPFFERLKSVGIFHETPESAARQMATVWKDISGWWESAEVQSVREEFCERYAHIPEKPLDVMEQFFRSIANNKIAVTGSAPSVEV
jgi:putative transferase (TIGR04331 family)